MCQGVLLTVMMFLMILSLDTVHVAAYSSFSSPIDRKSNGIISRDGSILINHHHYHQYYQTTTSTRIKYHGSSLQMKKINKGISISSSSSTPSTSTTSTTTSFQKASSLEQIHNLRKRFAGKKGSKNFLDPNKIFIGNLPFHVSEDQVLTEFLTLHLGHTQNIDSFKIIRDWKTKQSKGYGFIQFTEPIYATAAMISIQNKMYMGRVINLRQGMKKEKDENSHNNLMEKRQLYIKVRSRGKYTLDKEGSIIEAALDEVEDIYNHHDDHDKKDEEEEDTQDTHTPSFFHPKKDNKYKNDKVPRTREQEEEDSNILQEEEEVFNVEDFDTMDDSILFQDDNDDEEDSENHVDDDDDDDSNDYDGDFEEIYGPSFSMMKLEPDLSMNDKNGINSNNNNSSMNRQQRREAAKRRPRRKLPHKGFG